MGCRASESDTPHLMIAFGLVINIGSPVERLSYGMEDFMIKAGQSAVANPTAKKGFLIPVSWQVSDFVRVQADTLEDAYQWINEHIDEIPLGTEPEYIEASYETGTFEECEIYLDEMVEYDRVEAANESRLILFSDGDGMGDFLYVAMTNAPAEELNNLLARSREAIKKGEDMPIWQNILTKKGYIFNVIDEYRHVTAYGTSKSWREENYPNVTEEYFV